MKTVEIGSHSVGDGQPPFIVAEAGINHNGELSKAFDMIKCAKEAGVNAVKFQTFKTEEFVSDTSLKYSYRSQGREVTESMFEMFKRYEFSKEQWLKIKEKCQEYEITFLSTPQNRSDLNLLLEIGIDAVKVGSDDFTNLPLLKDYASTNLPLIVSCGMADLSEVYEALETIGTLDGYPTILLLCTSQYPTPPEDVNLLKLNTLRTAFPMLPVGFSDHTEGPMASSMAVGLGACFFEKHFTLDHDLPGPDHWFSENPQGLKEWVNSIRKAHRMMGNPLVRPTPKEREMRQLARRSVVALRDIVPGEMLSNTAIGLRRPGTGLPPSMISQVLGLKASRPLKKGELIRFGDFT